MAGRARRLACADGERALFLSRRGGRLTTRAASDVFTAITAHAGLEDATTAHVGRHTFPTGLIRGGEDLLTAAELAGHARLETLKVYSHPTDEDKHSALRHLTVDRWARGTGQTSGKDTEGWGASPAGGAR